MPELPEVERAVKLLQDVAKTKRITDVETFEDSIVFLGVVHNGFAAELKGRVVLDAKRYGKVFYIELDGQGRHPVLHFGMTGMLQVKGQLPSFYKEGPKSASAEWPPRFVKFILHLLDEESGETTELAFLDARRLGRIRLCLSPRAEPPICELGFDPILSMPSVAVFTALVQKRSCPIKALLLDQSFSAGVGNWVADEILYNAAIHPEQRCNTFTLDQLNKLHDSISLVCKTAVAVNADDSLFPKHWLFHHRWGKGKKRKGKPADILLLPSGRAATIRWITVGGRTSAYVSELQILPGPCSKDSEVRNDYEDDQENDLNPLAESEAEVSRPAPARSLRKRKTPQSHRPKASNDEPKATKPKKARTGSQQC